MSFINVILEEIKSGRITAYDPLNVNVNTTYADIETKLGAVERTESITINAQGDSRDTVIKQLAKPEEVKQLVLYEEWYFDKKLGKLDVRIIAVQPIFMAFDQDIGRIVKNPLFWVKYNDIRDVLANHEIFTPNNDAQRISFDDLFMQRRFGSVILAESNVYNDRFISDYQTGKYTLFEAERIKTDLFNFEHDLWEY
jgi:gliding motility associated protien GldN